MRRMPLIQLGDRFVTVGSLSRVFMVIVDDRPGRSSHATLSVRPEASKDTLTRAVAALAGPEWLRRL